MPKIRLLKVQDHTDIQVHCSRW